jgi:hypothetical protein
VISCETFRSQFQPGTENPAVLEHLRLCDACLDFAATADPDVLFRALGGGELVPPGGVDVFVAEVMQQVRVHEAQSTVGSRVVLSWPRRLAVAATFAAGLMGALFFTKGTSPVPAPAGIARPIASARAFHPVSAQRLTTRPVVESYESNNATIVEVPSDAADDVKIVMIFDEELPADL